MLVFTLLHPIKATMGNMFVAIGEPTEVLKVRLLQLLLLALGLFLLGPTWGILGVAFAVDIMAAVGTVALLHRAYVHVDYSVKRLFAAPLLALVTALVLAHAGAQIQALRVSDWFTGAVKAIVFTTVYGSLLLVLERQDLTKILRQVNFLRSKGPVRS
jgi:O-antigen/teichoic acid export membrane protein